MKLIFANKFHWRKGGADIYALDLAGMLRERGQEVIPFSMRQEGNLATEWDKYFVSEVNTDAKGLQALRTAGRFLWSFEAARKFGALLDKTKPSVVHVHNIYHQISPSILPVAKRMNVPVVMTAHDYSLLAPNYSLFHDGAICEVTKPNDYWKAVGHRCVRGSKAASFVCALEMTLHHKVLDVYRKNVDRIIAPSRFMQAMLIEYGWPEDKVVHVPHYVDTENTDPVYDGAYALYFGRLSEEKGVDNAIRAAAARPDMPLRIVGDGPELSRLEDLVSELGLSNVTFSGRLGGDDLKQALADAKFVVVPSVWYEPFGLVVLEAFAAGKPVIASQIGGLSEIIDEGETGFFVGAGDTEALTEKMSDLWDKPGLAERMGKVARERVEINFSVDKHLDTLLQVYRDLARK